jgi:hypothetical protein
LGLLRERSKDSGLLCNHCIPTVAILKERMKLKQTNYEIVQILNFSLLDKMPIQQLFEDYRLQNLIMGDSNQQKINL